MRNTSKYAYPKRNAPLRNGPPKYDGKKLWRSGDTILRCRDCQNYASHEAVLKREPDYFDKSERETVPQCPRHAKKSIALGICERIKPYDEYAAFLRARERFEAVNADGMQGILV